VRNEVQCPSCGDKKFAILRKFRFDALVRIWEKKVGFNPFPETEADAELEKLLCIQCGLAYYQPQIIGDADFYNKLSQFDWYYPNDKWDFDKAIELIKKYRPKSVLEVGCGAGEFLARIAGSVDSVMGLDINQSAIDVARSKGLDVSNQSVSSLSKSFDMIFLFQVLEHLASPSEFISSLTSKLNPGGYLVLAVPNPEGFMKFIDIVFLDMPPHHNTVWSKDTLVNMANAQRLNLVDYECEPMNYEYLRALLFAQIEQSKLWQLIKLTQKIMVLLMLPGLYFFRSLSKIDGQTHIVVLQKNE